MQTSDRSGIVCDHCGISHTHDFVYYSFDFHCVAVVDGRTPSLQMLHHTQVTCSLDICTACCAQVGQAVVENYKKCMSHIRGAAQPRVCEVSGVALGDSYYYCVVTKVDVKTTGQPNICVKCQKKTHDSSKPCTCGSRNYVRPASIRADKRFLEFNICEDAFVAMRKKAEGVRKTSSSWTTTT